MSAGVVNLLNELKKMHLMRGLSSIVTLFPQRV